MSVAGISSSNLYNDSMQSIQSKQQDRKQEFAQLGKDLQSGNLSAAQADFATLQQMTPPSSASGVSASAVSTSPVATAFAQLATDLKSGNLPAAQQDYSTIQQDMQSSAVQGFHHHHHRGAASQESQSSQSSQSSLFQELGQALQSGDLSTAQQVYSTLMLNLPPQGTATDPIILAAQTGAPSVSLEA